MATDVDCPRCSDSGTIESACPSCRPAPKPRPGWSDEHVEACVKRAYLLGVTDTLEAVLSEMDPSPEELLKRTHGMLAP